MMNLAACNGLRRMGSFPRATDLEGQGLFDGPITTEDDRKKIPQGVGERLWAMLASGQIPLELNSCREVFCLVK